MTDLRRKQLLRRRREVRRNKRLQEGRLQELNGLRALARVSPHTTTLLNTEREHVQERIEKWWRKELALTFDIDRL